MPILTAAQKAVLWIRSGFIESRSGSSLSSESRSGSGSGSKVSMNKKFKKSIFLIKKIQFIYP
jgi:hypothetical protein